MVSDQKKALQWVGGGAIALSGLLLLHHAVTHNGTFIEFEDIDSHEFVAGILLAIGGTTLLLVNRCEC